MYQDQTPLLITNLRWLLVNLSGQDSAVYPPRFFADVRDDLIELYSRPFRDSDLAGKVELPVVRDVIKDLITMIGQLGHRINSCERQRILRTLISISDKPSYQTSLSREQAESLVDEIGYCYNAVMTEVLLLSPRERANIVYPKIPRHRYVTSVDNPPQELTPEEKTKYCRERALSEFRARYFLYVPMFGLNHEEFNRVAKIEASLTTLVNEIDSRALTLDPSDEEFDYEDLGVILSADFRLYYTSYLGERYGEEITDDAIEETEQSKAKLRIIGLLQHYINSAIALAVECGSETSDIWSSMLVILEQCKGDFTLEHYKNQDTAESDLEEFLINLRRARRRLWVDWKIHQRDLKEKPIATDPQGAMMKKMYGMSSNIAYSVSDGEFGEGRKDNRWKNEIRRFMTVEGFNLVVNENKELSDAARIIIGRHINDPLAYPKTKKGVEALRKAIDRKMKSKGISTKSQRTKDTYVQ